ncbi:2-oxo acid dehydrogenase subunit E2 [Cryobacterium sinapicolor]|uniref:Dihydrolipoamide acetyltransferase component of pyruvate dehydrogenase complex n=1 Tax=Cryobacterium sinapicolor TaxID=1259236 RepID=A0ABY2JHE1_9MICO|nr:MULTISPECIES: dihydrolipoamide acetyltransferase family protein [Cryobacterium]TFC93795.1 2-oxo acid dehydrogenase subunit E2 [Cryobacterium sp. TMT3-29-2]TFD05327.1 2-oxo acid dehydrogenase subunit E2 [Cryobacterium sinapicolor]
MIKVFRLPDLGEGLTESEIVAWRVAPGETVTLNQLIAEVETAKAVVELPSPFAGVVAELHQQPGTTVHVGDPIVSFEVAGAEPPVTPADAAAPRSAGSGRESDHSAPPNESTGHDLRAREPEREAVLVGYGAAVERGGRPQRRARTGATDAGGPDARGPVARATVPGVTVPGVTVVTGEATVPAPPIAGERCSVTTERPRSTPPVRALARTLGVDLTEVTGTGPTGLITREDVEAHGAPAAPTALVVNRAEPAARPKAAAPGARETRSPIRSVRKLTAAAMVRSAFTAPHATEFLTVDVTPTMELIDALKRDREFADAHIGILAVVAKALCLAVARTPEVNTRWDEAADEIVQFHYVNLGIAAATPRGLLVPGIPDADRLGLADLAAALAELTSTARAGATSPAALTGGTISITNIGSFGIDAGTPILPPGEAVILALGAIAPRPWEHRGEIALRQVVTLSVAFDHRLVDGEQAARFLTDVAGILAHPARALALL